MIVCVFVSIVVGVIGVVFEVMGVMGENKLVLVVDLWILFFE